MKYSDINMILNSCSLKQQKGSELILKVPSAESWSSLGVKFKIEKRVEDKTEEEIIDYLTEKISTHRASWGRSIDTNVRIEDAGNISEFLEGVMVHPLAPKWYVDIVQEIC